MHTTPMPPTAPTAPTAIQVADFLRTAIPAFSPLLGKKLEQERFIDEIFDSEWSEYYLKKWNYMKKDGGIPRWIVNIDIPRIKIMMEELFINVKDPEIEISESTHRYVAIYGLPRENTIADFERSHHPLTFKYFAWQTVILKKLCIYCMNNYANKTVGKKKIECKDWGWTKWFMLATSEEQETFAETLISYK